MAPASCHGSCCLVLSFLGMKNNCISNAECSKTVGRLDRPHLSYTLYQWNSLLSAHYINRAPICNPKHWGVTTEMVLGRGNNHNPSNGSGRSNPHIVRVELGDAKSTCSCLSNNNRNESRCGELPFL